MSLSVSRTAVCAGEEVESLMCQTWVNKILLSYLSESQDGGNTSTAFLICKLDLTLTKDLFCLDVWKSTDLHFTLSAAAFFNFHCCHI